MPTVDSLLKRRNLSSSTSQKWVSIPIPKSFTKLWLQRAGRSLLSDRWSYELLHNRFIGSTIRTLLPTQRHFRFLVKNPNTLMSQVTSGHNYLNAFLHYMDFSISPNCRLCQFPYENSLHVISDCPHQELVTHRMSLFGSAQLSVEFMSHLLINEVLFEKLEKFVKLASRFGFWHKPSNR